MQKKLNFRCFDWLATDSGDMLHIQKTFKILTQIN